MTLTVGAIGFSQAGGTFTGGTAAITVNGPFSLTGGTFTSTSGTMTVTGNFTQGAGTFAPNGGILRFAGGAATIDVGGSATYRQRDVRGRDEDDRGGQHGHRQRAC